MALDYLLLLTRASPVREADDDVLLLHNLELPVLRRKDGRVLVSTRGPFHHHPEYIPLLGIPVEVEDLGGVP